MTVHKAKGLEYPVVFLPGMNQPPRSVTHGPAVIIGEDGDGVFAWPSRMGQTRSTTRCGSGKRKSSGGSTSGSCTWP